jgi:hypothetical protein
MAAFHRPLLLLPAALLLSAPVTAESPVHPLRFFEGRTEGTGTIKVVLKKPYHTRSVGRGRIDRDGALVLVQRVEEEGKPARERRWRIRQIDARRFSGTMSEAAGPVLIEEVKGRYRFRFKMKGNLSAEQWLTPLPGGRAARNTITVRKLGMTVATGSGTIKKVGAA